MRRPETMNSRAMMTIAIHAGSTSSLDEREERGGDEQLVGERVDELAEGGDLVARAREVAVDAVGRGEQREDQPRRSTGEARTTMAGALNHAGQSASRTSRNTGMSTMRDDA